MPVWQATDRGLQALHQRLPGFELDTVLVKVAAVNQLYSANVYAVARMAQHIVSVMANWATRSAVADLVEQIADLPPNPEDGKTRYHLSFASKFAHFFIDDVHCPVYDGYVIDMVGHLLGHSDMCRDGTHPYFAFVTNLDRLRTNAELECSYSELDHYLWIAGLYRAWCTNPKTKINSEARQLFSNPPSDLIEPLAALLPCGDVG